MLISDYHLDKAEELLKEKRSTICLDSSAREWLGKRAEKIVYDQATNACIGVDYPISEDMIQKGLNSTNSYEDYVDYNREDMAVRILVEMFHILVLGETLVRMEDVISQLPSPEGGGLCGDTQRKS